MEKNKITKKAGILAVMFILLAGYVYAFGISATYMENKTLKIYPGESKNIRFLLRNEIGSGETQIKVDIIEGSEIIKILNKEEVYTLPAEGDVPVNVRVSIPEDAQIGDIKNVAIGFATVTDSESGTFAIGSSILQKFKVLASSEETKSDTNENVSLLGTVLVLALIILVIVGALFFIRKKGQEKVK